MTLIVETGAIVSDANTYVTSDFVNTYHTNRGNSAWSSLADYKKDPVILRAFYGLENLYRGYWVGYPTDNNEDNDIDQVLAWPRKRKKLLTDSLMVHGREININSVPIEVKYAQCEAALIEIDTRIVPSVIEPEDYVKRELVHFAVETEFLSNHPVRNHYPILDRLLTGFVNASTDSTSIVVSYKDEDEDEDYIEKDRLRQFGLWPYNS